VTAALAAGELDLVVGTHALISEDVAYARLGLAVVDEQHRRAAAAPDQALRVCWPGGARASALRGGALCTPSAVCLFVSGRGYCTESLPRQLYLVGRKQH